MFSPWLSSLPLHIRVQVNNFRYYLNMTDFPKSRPEFPKYRLADVPAPAAPQTEQASN